MPRPLRASVGYVAYHVLNRANAQDSLFGGDEDYAAFECVLAQVCERIGLSVASSASSRCGRPRSRGSARKHS